MDRDQEQARRFLEWGCSLGARRLRRSPTGGLFHGEMAVMMHLYNADQQGIQGVTPSQLAKKLEVSRASVTTTLNGLEAKGFLQRTVSPSDRRRAVITVTDQGRQMIAGRVQHALDSLAYVAKQMGEQQFDEMLRLCQLAVGYMRDYHQLQHDTDKGE